MLHKISFDSFITSKDFLQDQFIFEKVVLEQIVSKCSKVEDPQKYNECVKNIKHYRKSYRQFVQAFNEKREKQLEKYLNDKCMSSDTMENLRECIRKETKQWMDGTFKRDCGFLSGLRKLTTEKLVGQL